MIKCDETKVIKDVKLNKETIVNFDLRAVELTDIDDNKWRGHFIIKNKKYYLLPFNDFFTTYVFSLSSIKSIKHLTNNVIIKR